MVNVPTTGLIKKPTHPIGRKLPVPQDDSLISMTIDSLSERTKMHPSSNRCARLAVNLDHLEWRLGWTYWYQGFRKWRDLANGCNRYPSSLYHGNLSHFTSSCASRCISAFLSMLCSPFRLFQRHTMALKPPPTLNAVTRMTQANLRDLHLRYQGQISYVTIRI